ISIGNPKSLGKLPLTSRQESPPSSLRITSQCFCMKSVFGLDGCIAIRWTQCPTSACGSGMYCECKPWLIGFQLLPPSSVRNAPAAEIAMKMRFGFFGSIRVECRNIPPAEGCHLGPVLCLGIQVVSFTDILQSFEFLSGATFYFARH